MNVVTFTLATTKISTKLWSRNIPMKKNVRGGTNRNVEKLTTTIKHYTPAKLICSSFQKEFINPCEKYAIKASL